MQVDLVRVRSLLPDREVYYFETTTTTMAEAARLAAKGAAAGTVVLAGKQTAGRGRMGRTWYSEAGSGLYLTLILRPVRPVPLMTLAVGLGVRAAIAAELGSEAVDIRWPNDILLSGRKCAGILLTSDGDAVLAGVGVNVNHRDFPEDIAPLATSLSIESGREHVREVLLAGIVTAIERTLQLEPGALREAFARTSSYGNGRRVELEDGGERGVTCGLDSEGFLLLRLDDGTVKRVIAGGVRPV